MVDSEESKGAHCFAEVNERLCWVYTVLLRVLLSQRCRRCGCSSSRSLGLREIGQNQRKPSAFKVSDLCPYYNRRVHPANNASCFHILFSPCFGFPVLLFAGIGCLCGEIRHDGGNFDVAWDRYSLRVPRQPEKSPNQSSALKPSGNSPASASARLPSMETPPTANALIFCVSSVRRFHNRNH